MYIPTNRPCFESAPSTSGATPWVAPGRGAGGLGPAIRESAAALWCLLDRAQPVLRGTLVVSWCPLAFSGWLLLVLALPLAVARVA
jgi:hypothetical protein